MKWKQLKAAKVNNSSDNQNTDTYTVILESAKRCDLPVAFPVDLLLPE
jgi:hypothetical protein